MMSFSFIKNKFFLIAVGLLFTQCMAQSSQEKDKKPNVIVFLIDDYGWMDAAFQGSPLYETPNIDKLAEEGMFFSQAYAAYPRCVPSRYAILTGRFPARAGIPGRNGGLSKKEFTLAKAVKKEGYTTFFAGKWHLSQKGVYPKDAGFDLNIAGGDSGAPQSYFYPYNTGGKERRAIKGLGDGKKGEYLTDRLTNETISFIKGNSNQPFMAMLSHYAVHAPFEAKKDYTKKYDQKVKGIAYAEPEYISEGPGETKMRHDNGTYAGMIQSVDESLGKILKTLNELGIADNTVVILTSDHGGLSNRGNNRELATSNHPLRAGKGWLYEGGIRVPLIVKWPKVTKAGSSTDAVITGTDYYPTILDIIGAPKYPEAHLDGKSFSSVLQGKEDFKRGPIYWHSPRGRPNSTGDTNSSAMRNGSFKLIEWYDEGRIELYNIRKDMGEQHDLSKKMPQKTTALLKQLHQWRNDIHAVIADENKELSTK